MVGYGLLVIRVLLDGSKTHRHAARERQVHDGSLLATMNECCTEYAVVESNRVVHCGNDFNKNDDAPTLSPNCNRSRSVGCFCFAPPTSDGIFLEVSRYVLIRMVLDTVCQVRASTRGPLVSIDIQFFSPYQIRIP